jgi:hypothetical protein
MAAAKLNQRRVCTGASNLLGDLFQLLVCKVGLILPIIRAALISGLGSGNSPAPIEALRDLIQRTRAPLATFTETRAAFRDMDLRRPAKASSTDLEIWNKKQYSCENISNNGAGMGQEAETSQPQCSELARAI